MCSLPIGPRRARFCSEACRYKWRITINVAPFECPGCERTVTVPLHKLATRKYCTTSCARATYNRLHRRGDGNGRWRGGRALSYGPGWKKIKERIRARDKVCRGCGKTPEQNGRALDVHHDDPFRFSGDNSDENLRALCRSCHMQADDNGRARSARFLRGEGSPPRPTKRELRRLRQLTRAAEATARRRERQREAGRRAEQGQSLRQIARGLGVSHQTVSNWLNGAHLLAQS